MSPPGADGADPWGLVTGAEGMITGIVVCAAAIAYACGHVDSIAQLTGARGGLDTWGLGRIASGIAGAVLGLVVALLKVALH